MTAMALRRSHPTDAELLVRVAAGELGGLGALFDRYEGDIKRFIGRMGVDASDVDDLVQLTFLDLVRAAPSFDGRPSARNWLFSIANMVVRRHRRSIMRMAKALGAWANEPALPPETASQSFELQESAARARRALHHLSVKKRAVFVMIVLEGLSGEDVAGALGIPVATVWTRLHHARRELRRHLARERA